MAAGDVEAEGVEGERELKADGSIAAPLSNPRRLSSLRREMLNKLGIAEKAQGYLQKGNVLVSMTNSNENSLSLTLVELEIAV